MLIMQCKFVCPCKYYDRDSFTCNNNSEAEGYCGAHTQFTRLGLSNNFNYAEKFFCQLKKLS